jgi:hypothetical protein
MVLNGRMIVNGDLGRFWKEVIMHGGNEENHKKASG